MIYQYLLYQQINQTVENSLKILIRCMLISGFMFAFSPANNRLDQIKMITKNDMTVGWEYKNDRIHFTMQAPVEGWVTIGFNITENISGTYLVMGNVVAGVPRVVEHYTVSPGNYHPLVELGCRSAVNDLAGAEHHGKTTLKFSLPVDAITKYSRDLKEGTSYIMVLAYSREDDFQHHSIMRTSLKIRL